MKNELYNHVFILNRFVEENVSLRIAYYGVFGDNVCKKICYDLFVNDNCSEKLIKLLRRELKK